MVLLNLKPSGLVSNVKPSNLLAKDIKPEAMGINKDTATRSYEVSYVAGQSMGLLLALTYTTSGTGTHWSEKG